MSEIKKCGKCKWLNGEENLLGIRCTNPNKKFHKNKYGRTRCAQHKKRSTRACLLFEEKEC